MQPQILKDPYLTPTYKITGGTPIVVHLNDISSPFTRNDELDKPVKLIYQTLFHDW